jgi:uncharacterized protein (DUF2235 family)
VAKRDGAVPQILYYDQGVGTGNLIDRYTGGAFGEGLEDNIHDAYRFLIENYEPGDELSFFGFSRGAFTARSIVGMIRKCGVLRREFVEHYRDAMALYHSAEHHPDDDVPVKFRTDYSVSGADPIPVRMIGVWDTVGALGIPLRGLRSLTRSEYQFHDTELSGIVQLAFHALAVDEHREPFEPTLWAYKPKPGQIVEQVWFPGVHSDVGGGYPETGLSDIALEWMISKAQGAGLAFDAPAIASHPLHPDPLGVMHDSKTGVYRLSAGIDRRIGAVSGDGETESADPTQSVHDSVIERWDRDVTYRPESLRQYFRRVGDNRADQ